MSKWTGKTHGSLLGYRIIIGFMQLFGLRFTYLILRVVSFYFFLFAPSSKKYLIKFYQEGLGYSKKKANSLVRQNFFLLAQSIIDKIALSMGLGDQITVSHEGNEWLRKLSREKKGAFLISAHLSNWDIASRSFKGYESDINVVMLENEHENIKKLLDQNQQGKFNVIGQTGDMSHLIKIYQAIKKGGFVCMHADRFVEGAKTYALDFLGKKAQFPAGPFEIIEKLKTPYTFVFTVKTSQEHYHFSSTEPEIAGLKAENIAIEFVKLLEEKVKMNPEQWFNYHDFYQAS